MMQAKSKSTAFDVALVALMVAVIEVFKFAMIGLPNIELTSFWLILFSKNFGKRVYFVVPVFTLIEGMIFGFNLWWISYLYVWPLLVFVTQIFKKSDSALTWAVISAVFGLSFGFLCALPYLFTGTDLQSGLTIVFSQWVAGIPWDITHCIGNFVLTLLLYKPLSEVMLKIQQRKIL
jgi:energy-coupling factor transport system substrate-specific component